MRARFDTLCSLSLGTAFGLMIATTLQAVDLGTGLVAIEDGDDRMRPAAVLQAASAGGYMGRFYLYGRDYGPVQERNYLLSLDKRFDIASKSLQGLVGVACLYDSTSIKFPENPEDDDNFSSTNIGGAFGLHWTFVETKVARLQLTWDGHVFPAGSGFIFLANARKSAIGVTASTEF